MTPPPFLLGLGLELGRFERGALHRLTLLLLARFLRLERERDMVIHFRDYRADQTTIYLLEFVLKPQYIHNKIGLYAVRPLIFVSDHDILIVPGWK